MRRNQKIHAIAIVSICVLITVIYTVLTPTPPTAASAANSDRAIEIFDATWGKECNPAITAAMHNPPALTHAADNNAAPPPKLALVQDNNVLTQLSNMCNGQLTCQVKANSETLGVEPIQTCFKHLVVRYRCFSYDRAWDVTTNQGDTLTIDCNAPPPPVAKH
jgi:hypothetical protein